MSFKTAQESGHGPHGHTAQKRSELATSLPGRSPTWSHHYHLQDSCYKTLFDVICAELKRQLKLA